ncbi:MAG: hypothetical protein KKA44_06885 [Alphaproteobacteria bacterium]|nr:hypothetical protein [Alphaproteobacteria bacterium]MBU0866474.1 hypothetical protein [Alphaproteobacteria bacterium]MBU1824688.1 hypothetical protein [Alphaproteobacteria bacterium]
MGCEIPISKAEDTADLRCKRDEGQLLRGAYLDAFARLEMSVADRLAELGRKPKTGMAFGLRLEYLANARERFADPVKLDERIDAVKRLNDVRTDLVHSVLTVIVHYNGSRAIDYWFGFQNACQKDKMFRTMTIDDLRAITRETNKLAKQIRQQQLKATTPAAPASASA